MEMATVSPVIPAVMLLHEVVDVDEVDDCGMGLLVVKNDVGLHPVEPIASVRSAVVITSSVG